MWWYRITGCKTPFVMHPLTVWLAAAVILQWTVSTALASSKCHDPFSAYILSHPTNHAYISKVLLSCCSLEHTHFTHISKVNSLAFWLPYCEWNFIEIYVKTNLMDDNAAHTHIKHMHISWYILCIYHIPTQWNQYCFWQIQIFSFLV